MDINNDVRRLKIKLKLFEEEGFNWVVRDIIDFYGNGFITMEQTETAVKSLKMHYLQELEALLPKDSKQGKLEL